MHEQITILKQSRKIELNGWPRAVVPTNSWSLFSRQLMLNNKVLYRACVVVRNRALWKDKANFIRTPSPSPTSSTPVSNTELWRTLLVSLRGNFSRICFLCAPSFERSSFPPYFLLFHFPKHYMENCRCYWASRRLKEMLPDSPACRSNTCSIMANLNPADPGSDINLPEDS